jgi:hypothetical protein
MMFAAGWLLVSTRLMGRTTKVLGAKPKLHCSSAPLQTCSGIEAPGDEAAGAKARPQALSVFAAPLASVGLHAADDTTWDAEGMPAQESALE